MTLLVRPDSVCRSVALGKGFLGLINRVRARDILTIEATSNLYLIRFSRTMPEYLAFSYKGVGGQIGHFVNSEANGDIIPVRTFIARKFPAFEPVRVMGSERRRSEREREREQTCPMGCSRSLQVNQAVNPEAIVGKTGVKTKCASCRCTSLL